MNSSLLLKIVASSVSCANRAGSVIREIVRTGELGVIDKAAPNARFDPQTEADRAAQKIIVGSLAKQYSGLKIIGEEDDCDTVDDESLLVSTADDSVIKETCPANLAGFKLEDLVVWVDPVDGTREFTDGYLDHVTVLIGISAKGKAVAGIIHQPFFNYNTGADVEGRTCWGIVGAGLHGMKTIEPVVGRHIVTTTKSHGSEHVMEAVNAMSPDSVIRSGGAGYKVLQVVEGVADAYVYASKGCKKWDTCAPEAILVAAGGELTNIHGEKIDYNVTDNHVVMQGVLATRSDHSYYVDRVPESVKKGMR